MKTLFYFALALALDQVSKLWILGIRPSTEAFLGLQYSENYGILFGIALPTAVIFALTLAILTGALGIFWMEQKKRVLSGAEHLAFALVVAGGIGNLIDRIRLGFVVDFIHIGPYPNFNLADAWILIGVCLILWSQWRNAKSA